MGTIGAGIAGETRFLLARVGAVEVGSVGYQAPVVGFSEGSALDLSLADGVVGTAFLHRFTVVFDHPRSRVLLIPNDARPEADEFDMSGLPLTSPAPGRVVVHRVLPGSPAAAAGVEPGDLLRGVDGVPVRRYTLDGLRELLARGPGSRHALVVLRDGEERSVVIRLRRLV
jgi:S1-C subfamily serine protease